MGRWLALGLVVWVALGCGARAGAAAEPGVVYVTGAAVNVRAAASTEADRRATARRGDRLTVLARDGAWVQVRAGDGRVGWIHGDFVADEPPAVGAAEVAKPRGLSDGEIRKRLVAESIAEYPGNCACPYHTDRAGRSCGRRSAWSKPGGRAPLCYPRDVSAAMVDDYRARHGE